MSLEALLPLIIPLLSPMVGPFYERRNLRAKIADLTTCLDAAQRTKGLLPPGKEVLLDEAISALAEQIVEAARRPTRHAIDDQLKAYLRRGWLYRLFNSPPSAGLFGGYLLRGMAWCVTLVCVLMVILAWRRPEQITWADGVMLIAFGFATWALRVDFWRDVRKSRPRVFAG